MTTRRRIRRCSLAIAVIVVASGGSTLGGIHRAGALKASKTNIASTPHNQVVGYPVTLKATIPGRPLPTGTVQFFEGATPLGSPVATVKHVATLSYEFPRGTHSVSATYSGDGVWASSDSKVVTIIVGDPSHLNVDLLYRNPGGLPVSSWTPTTPVVFTAQIVVKVGQTNYGARTGPATVNIDGTLYDVTVKNSRIVYLASGGLGSVGEHTASATYHGDIHYLPDTSITRHITISNP